MFILKCHQLKSSLTVSRFYPTEVGRGSEQDNGGPQLIERILVKYLPIVAN